MNTNQETKEFDPKDLLDSDDEYEDELDLTDFEYKNKYRKYYEIEAKIQKLFNESISLHDLFKNPYLLYKGFKKLYKKLSKKESDYNHILYMYESDKRFIKRLLKRAKEAEEKAINIDTKFYTQTIRRQAQTIQYLQNELNKHRH